MAHNIDMTNGRANIAFRGSASDVWHRMGQEMQAGMDVQAWAKAAGLDWTAIKVPALVDLSGPEFKHIQPDGYLNARTMPDRKFVVRSDNGHALGYVSDQYQPVQPADVLDWFSRYIDVNPDFQLDVAGSLKQGEIIWATATYNGGVDVAGDKHVARLLMTTTFDGTGSTINKPTMTRVVCNNTLSAALGSERKSEVRTRHNTRFDAARVAKELEAICKGFTAYKAMGDAMASAVMSVDDIRSFFKAVLDIKPEDKPEDVSTRKMNQYQALGAALRTTKAERNTNTLDAWIALNAVTRWVDHDRKSEAGADGAEKSFLSSQFGSGAAVKDKAVQLLMPRIRDLVAA